MKTPHNKKISHQDSKNSKKETKNQANLKKYFEKQSSGYISVLDYFFLTGNCRTTIFPSHEYIAMKTGLSVRHVSRITKQLDEEGFVLKEKRPYTSCMFKINPLFNHPYLRENLKHLFKAFLYLPLAILMSSYSSASEENYENVRVLNLFNNYIYKKLYTPLRRHTPEFEFIRSLTSNLLKPSKYVKEDNLFKKNTQKGESDNRFTMPQLLPLSGFSSAKKLSTHEQELLDFRTSVKKWTPELIALYREKELQNEINTSKNTLTPTQNKSIMCGMNSAQQNSNEHPTLKLLKQELREYRNSIKQWDMEKLTLYNDFRVFIQQLEQSMTFNDEEILKQRKKLQAYLPRQDYPGQKYNYPDGKALAAQDYPAQDSS